MGKQLTQWPLVKTGTGAVPQLPNRPMALPAPAPHLLHVVAGSNVDQDALDIRELPRDVHLVGAVRESRVTRTVTHLPEQSHEPGRQQHCTMLPAQVYAGSTALKDGTDSPKGPRGVNGVGSAKDTELVSGTSRSFPVGEQAETCEQQGKGSPQGQRSLPLCPK